MSTQRASVPHALVTGAARGIGAATAGLLARDGYAVTVTDVLDTSATVRAVEAAGGTAAGVEADVSDRAAIRAVVESSVARFGRLDAVVTSAGVYGTARSLDDTDEAELDFVLGVNLRGTVWTIQAALPHLRRQGGRVVCIGSLAGRIGGLRSGPAYAASKGAIHALVRWLAQAEAPHRILVNGVAPGVVATPMIDGRGYTPEPLPLRRFAEAAEIAEVAAFLISPAASYMTGTVVDVNGGVHVS